MQLTTSFACLVAFATSAFAYLDNAHVIEARQLADSYDYIVVGGGHAGSVISSRLSELEDKSVLLIEAGGLDQQEDFVTIPRNAGGAMGSKYDWNYTTVAMSEVNNRAIGIPAGKVIGGGTVLNGMAFDRPSKSDLDAWVDLGNTGWGWDDLLPYFKKSETFTPPPAALAQEFNITYDPSAHGTSGPIFSSYPNWLNPVLKNWFRGLTSLGIYTELDGANGRALNAFWSPNALHPTNMSRSYARNGYFDPASKRANFHVLLNTQVTKLVGSGSPVTINSVEFAAGQGQPTRSVRANKEVIVSAGAIGTPRILQLSGIGPASVLQRANVPVVVDLPGVGSNYQDHSYVMTFNFLMNGPPQPDDAQARQQYLTSRTGPYTNSGPNAFVFLPLNKVSSRGSSILSQVNAQTPAQYLRSGTDQTIVAGFAKQKEIIARRLATDTMAASELVFSGGSIMCSTQHPLSRGYVEITSNNPFATPAINFRYGSNPLDNTLLTDIVRYSRTILNTAAIRELNPMEFSPGTQVTTDDALINWIKQQKSTMFHSCCTAPMQARELGGVVDTNAKVYGTSNLRIVDASIIPIIPASHPQSTVYALAEKVADLVKADA